jgi:hypothetical protein
MAPSNAELEARVSKNESLLITVSTKAERISELVSAMEKLESRVRVLEERKSQLDDIVGYKETSDNRIRSLEETKWYYAGGLKTIGAIFVTSGILGVIAGIIITISINFKHP